MDDKKNEYFQSKFAEISYLSEQRTVEVLWREQTYDPSNYHLVLTKALVLSKQQDVSAFLIDLTVLKELSVQDRDWFSKTLFPNFVGHDIARLVLILDPQVFNRQQGDYFRKLAASNHMMIRYFYNRKDADSWLSATL